MSNRDKQKIELGLSFTPKFNQDGLIPVIVQDVYSKAVIMFAFMNKDALNATLELGEMVYYSRSRGELWHKGKTSGAVQKVVSLKTDCDQDVVLAFVTPEQAGACHNGYESCFYRDVASIDDLQFNDTVQALNPANVYGK